MAAAILFDLDGTLLNTLGSLAEAFNSSLADMSCPPHDIDAYRHFIGNGARVAAMRALPPTRQQLEDINQCVEGFKQHYQANWRSATVFAGIPEILAQLSHLPLAVLSNKDEVFTRQCCDYFFPGVFQAVVGFSETVKAKPDPSGALSIASEFQLNISDLWMVGDTATDMKTACACDMTGVGVLWGFRDRDELANGGATHIINNPSELSGLLGL
ncbi:MAG: HAD family hydrolase [Gammaproteobacteria bacterium]|jgi:phosphoglycolate phosphatase|nr:HAD family hydrolase [Gammaproteobacteria bacterium]MBT4494242.1 HAD family hydrolase [Gammaproteobacteria bacterium]